MLTASYVFKEHPFEMRQEDEVPELAAAIRECDIWPSHRSLAVFRSPSTARDRSREFDVLRQDTWTILTLLISSFITRGLKVTRLLSHEVIECTYLEISQARLQSNVE